ncbi:MAG: DUF2118 domain-containing protein [Desulfurococcaceae archaeon]
MSEQYVFPEVFVKGCSNGKYICFTSGAYFLSLKADGSVKCDEVYGLIPYERLVEFIDLEKGKLKTSVITLREELGKEIYEGYIVEPDAELCLQEIVGNYIYFLKDDGSNVKRGNKLAYIVTNKLEARSVKSRCDGLLLFIIDMPWMEPRRGLLVVVKSGYRHATIRKGA